MQNTVLTMQMNDILLQCIHTLNAGEDLDGAIHGLLEIIARFHGADRAYIFEFSEDMVYVNNTYEWCQEGIESQMHLLGDVETRSISRWISLFEEQGEVFINSLDGELPKDSEEYRLLASLGIKGLMEAPLILDGKLIGFLGVDNPSRNTDTLFLLRFVAAFAVNDIQKRETVKRKVIGEEKRRKMEYQRALAEALEDQDEMYAEMLKMLGTGVVAYDVETREICLINDAAREMFGFQEDRESGGDFTELQSRVVSGNKEGFLKGFQEALKERGEYTCEYALNNGKRLVYILGRTKIIVLGNGRKVSVSSLMDVTEKRMLEEQLRLLSRTDALTKINNRGYGERRIEELVEKGVSGMFCLFDVDKFKSINDSFGHATGDRVLCAIAECLKASFGKEDVVMRLGGDEFAAYVVGTETEEEGSACIKGFFDGLGRVQVEEIGSRRISVSLGAVLCIGAQKKQFDELYQMADSAMYHCKRNGGGCFVFYRTEADRG